MESEGWVTWGPAGGAWLVGHLGPGTPVPVVHRALGREAQALRPQHLVLGVRGASPVLHGIGYGALERGDQNTEMKTRRTVFIVNRLHLYSTFLTGDQSKRFTICTNIQTPTAVSATQGGSQFIGSS